MHVDQKQHEEIWKCGFEIRVHLALLNNVQNFKYETTSRFSQKGIIMHKERKIVSAGTDNNELFHLASILM